MAAFMYLVIKSIKVAMRGESAVIRLSGRYTHVDAGLCRIDSARESFDRLSILVNFKCFDEAARPTTVKVSLQ
jgi:hypothetical protein